ncbi:MAG: hydrogenase expression/formation protein HypE [Nitrospirae bacterium]|nr:MAG: hydrogenase expression/formation protein HypE [Nitrospirota bacterium]
MSEPSPCTMHCPVPSPEADTIRLAHGGGGRLTHALTQEVFLPAFENPVLASLHDGALLSLGNGRLAFTTDSYVVQPLCFPGGDIGSLAVHGTVNDLAMCGAQPRALSAGFIIEEGLSKRMLEQIVASMAQAAKAVDIPIVCGDTKVVDHGKGDQLFITTSGIGIVPDGIEIAPSRIRPGDRILLSGDIGRHGIAVLSSRAGLTFAGEIASDSAPLHTIVADVIAHGIDVHCLRDLTRGGLGSALNELAISAAVSMVIDEAHIPVSDAVRGACEILGLDPLYVANEGRCVLFVPPQDSLRALSVLRRHPVSQNAADIGEVHHAPATPHARVILQTIIGTHRIVEFLSGEQLPRIC